MGEYYTPALLARVAATYERDYETLGYPRPAQD